MSGPSGGSSSSESSSSSSVWSPYAEPVSNMLETGRGKYDRANETLNSPQLQNDLNQWNQGVQDTSMAAWQQQAQGGNLAGYDIAGGLNNMIGQGNQVGPVQQSHAFDLYNSNVGPGGSLANMEGMYRRQADVAGQDMLSSLDARAAASGMSGGSRHGTATGMGFEGINQNLQNQMASTGYDAYNRDLDRKLNIGSQNDQFNQQRALADQNVTQNTQQQMAQMLGQQNQSQQAALAGAGNMAGLGGLGYQAATQPFMSWSQMLQGMGPATVLNESDAESNSMNFGV